MLEILFTILGLLVSPIGWFALGLGFVLFFMLPLIPRATGEFRGFAHFYLWLGAYILHRGSIIVSEQGDLLLKRMVPTDTGTEKISFRGTEKEFEDPYQQKSTWFGMPFAFGNEKHGFFFHLKDAALGRRKKEHEESEGMIIKATASERNTYEVYGWYRGLFELPAKAYEFVDLNFARQLVTGSERAEDPQRVRTFYKHSRAPYESGGKATKFIMLIVAVVGPFAALWLIASQLQSGGGGGTSGPTVSTLFLLATPVAWLRNRWKSLAIGCVLFGLPLLLIAFLTLVVGIVATIAILSLVLFGYLLLPIIGLLLKKPAGSLFGKLFTKFGFLGYAKPVIIETTSGYTLKEFSEVDEATNVVWHMFLGRMIGFAIESDPAMWGTELADVDMVKNNMVEQTTKTNIPSGYNTIPERQRAMHGAFVPSNLRKNKYYLWMSIALERFKNVATGNKTQEQLENAKEEFGGDNGISDKAMIISMSVLGSISFGAGVFVFFL